MKTLHRHNSSTRGSRRLVLAFVSIAALALFGIDALFGGPIRSIVRDGASLVTRSVQSVGTSIGASGLLTSHRSLAEENIALRSRIASLQSLAEENRTLKEDNESLRALTNAVGQVQEGVTVAVRSGMGTSLYGTFLIGAGAQQGLIRNAPVYTEGKVLVGFVSDVSQNTAQVRMLLASGVETEGLIGSTTGVTVIGRGSGNGIAYVPRDTEVAVGDPVYYSDARSVIGIVGAIESSPSNAEKTVYLRLPKNPFGVRFVTVLAPL